MSKIESGSVYNFATEKEAYIEFCDMAEHNDHRQPSGYKPVKPNRKKFKIIYDEWQVIFGEIIDDNDFGWFLDFIYDEWNSINICLPIKKKDNI